MWERGGMLFTNCSFSEFESAGGGRLFVALM